MRGGPRPAVRDLPSAIDRRDELRAAMAGGTPAVFLDYDGTLTPIVERPEDATLPEETRRAVKELATRCPVAVVSGRDLADVRAMVGIDGIFYAGSHGFDIAGPGGRTEQRAIDHLPHLAAAEAELRPAIGTIPGARLERKRFAVCAHVRQVEEARVGQVEAAVDAVAARHPELRKTIGKKVFELRPNVEWDKGRALQWLLEVVGADGDDIVPLYVGDDLTDEDAFRTIAEHGIGVVVRGEDDARETSARYSLADTDEVRRFLDSIPGSPDGTP